MANIIESFDSFAGFSTSSQADLTFDGALTLKANRNQSGSLITTKELAEPLTSTDINRVTVFVQKLNPLLTQNIGIQFGDSAGSFSNLDFDVNVASIGTNARVDVGEWLVFDANDLNNSNATFEQLRVRAYNTLSPFTATFKVDNLIINVDSKATFIFSFDDAENTCATIAEPKLTSAGFKGQLYLSTGLVGQSDSLSWSQVQDLKNAGWAIGVDGTPLTTPLTDEPTVADAVALAISQWQDLRDNNLDSDDMYHFCYPNGQFFDTSISRISIGAMTSDGSANVTLDTSYNIKNGDTIYGVNVPLGTTVVSGGSAATSSLTLSNPIPTQTISCYAVDENQEFYLEQLPNALEQAGFKTGRITGGGGQLTCFGMTQKMTMLGQGLSGQTLTETKAIVDKMVKLGLTMQFYIHRIEPDPVGWTEDTRNVSIHVYESFFNGLVDYVKTKVDSNDAVVMTQTEQYLRDKDSTVENPTVDFSAPVFTNNVWKPTGTSNLYSPTLGNLLSSTIRVVSENVTWSGTGGYWIGQAAANSADREFGLYNNGSTVYLIAGGSVSGVGTWLSLFPNNIEDQTLELQLDFNTGNYDLLLDGVSAKSGTITVGTSRVDDVLFRIGARNNSGASSPAGGFELALGTLIGNTHVYIDGVLARSYIMPSDPASTEVVDSVSGENMLLRDENGSFSGDDFGAGALTSPSFGDPITSSDTVTLSNLNIDTLLVLGASLTNTAIGNEAIGSYYKGFFGRDIQIINGATGGWGVSEVNSQLTGILRTIPIGAKVAAIIHIGGNDIVVGTEFSNLSNASQSAKIDDLNSIYDKCHAAGIHLFQASITHRRYDQGNGNSAFDESSMLDKELLGSYTYTRDWIVPVMEVKAPYALTTRPDGQKWPLLDMYNLSRNVYKMWAADSDRVHNNDITTALMNRYMLDLGYQLVSGVQPTLIERKDFTQTVTEKGSLIKVLVDLKPSVNASEQTDSDINVITPYASVKSSASVIQGDISNVGLQIFRAFSSSSDGTVSVNTNQDETNSELQSDGVNGTPTLIVSGLEPNKLYDVTAIANGNGTSKLFIHDAEFYDEVIAQDTASIYTKTRSVASDALGNILVGSEGLLSGVMIESQGVTQSDNQAPVITLSTGHTNGDTITLTTGDDYTPPVATLTDNVDATRVVQPTTNTLDTSAAGNYYIEWVGINDAAGNAAAALRLNFIVSDLVITKSNIQGHMIDVVLTIAPVKVNLSKGVTKMYQWQPSKRTDEVEQYSIEIDQEWLIGREIDNVTITPPQESGLTINGINVYRNTITATIRGGATGSHAVAINIESEGRVRQVLVFLTVE